MSFEYRNKTAFITGGSNGIGAALSRRLSKLDVNVILGDIDSEQGQGLAKEIDGQYIHLDVRNKKEIDDAIAHIVNEFGSLDIAVLNAGISTGFS